MPGKSLPGRARRRGNGLMQKRGRAFARDAGRPFKCRVTEISRSRPLASTPVQAAEAGRAAALASSSNAVEMSRMLMTPIRL